jgi:hypothetical protein
VYQLSEENELLVTKLVKLKDVQPSNHGHMTVQTQVKPASRTTPSLLLLLAATAVFAIAQGPLWHPFSSQGVRNGFVMSRADGMDRNWGPSVMQSGTQAHVTQGCSSSAVVCPIADCPVKECDVEPAAQVCLPCPVKECPACESKRVSSAGSAQDCLMVTQSLSLCANQVSTFALELQRLER